MPSGSETSDFDLAKRIEDTLKGVEKDRQERVLRWVAETLGISCAPPKQHPEPHTPAAHLTIQTASTAHESATRDIKSFVGAKKPKNDMQFAAVVAYFYQFNAPENQQKQAITTDDLKDAARKAQWRQPPQPSATLNNAVAAGYLDRAGRGSFSINAVGENLVAMTLPGDQDEQTRRPRVARKRKAGRAKSKSTRKGRAR